MAMDAHAELSAAPAPAAPESPCDAALRRALASPSGVAAALSRHLSLAVLPRAQPLPACGGGAPCLWLLCRRSDAPAGADAAFEPAAAWPAVLAAGGRALFVQPGPREGVVHILEDRLASAAGGEVAALLAHEMTHAADGLLHGWDLARGAALACSEVRAASFAECPAVQGGASGGGGDWLGTRARCVRGAARRSAELAFPGGTGAAAVDAVFSACYDTPLVLGDAAQQRAALRGRGGAAVAEAVLSTD